MSSASMPGTEPERASRSARMRMLRETREFASVRWWLRSMGCRLGPGDGHGGPSARDRRKFVGAAVWSGDYKEKAAEIGVISAA